MARHKKERASGVWITPLAIEAIGLKHFGDTWRQTLPLALEMSYSQFHRYMTRIQDVPKTTAMALVALDAADAETLERTLSIPDYVTDADKAEPVKYVPVKKERPERPSNDAPEAGFTFGASQPVEPEPQVSPKVRVKATPAKPKKAPAKSKGKKGATLIEDAKTIKRRAASSKIAADSAKKSATKSRKTGQSASK